MPRDSNGDYDLPAGNPVVTGTIIASVWANDTMSDVATALTDSLSRSGDGGMLAPLELVAGLIGAPSLVWALEATSGFYRAGAGDFRWAIGGVDIWGITAQGINIQKALRDKVVVDAAVTTNKTIDLSLGNEFDFTMTGSTLFAFSNPPPAGVAQTITVFLKQDATGTRIATWPASVKWSDGTTPVLTTTAGRVDAVTLTTMDAGVSYRGGQVLANITP